MSTTTLFSQRHREGRKRLEIADATLMVVDSLSLDSLGSDSLALDSMAVDSTATETSGSVLDAIVELDAVGHIRYDSKTNKVVLLDKGVIRYKDIELAADYIVYSKDSSEVYARGVKDSTGVIVGKPIFKQGSEEFETDELRYNFETGKAIITGITTEQQGGFVHSDRTKMMNDSTYALVNGRYTTCDAEHPHFYIHMTKAKMLKDDRIVTGPAYLVFEDVPLYPIGLPFAFFPMTESYSSGILMPSYGEEANRGFFMRDLGYYWAASEYFDAAFRADLYSNGSWGVKLRSNYKKRYKYSGSFDVKFNMNVSGEKGITEGSDAYAKSRDFSIIWTHSQDSKANPSQSINASVNFSTSSYDLNNSTYATDYLTNTKSSTISYTKSWGTSPFRLAGSLRHSQNSLDTTISLSIPELALTMSRVYPLKKKVRIGPEKWYEKMGFQYTMNLQNKISTNESELMSSSLSKDWSNGIKHTIPLSLSLQVLDYITLSPSINYTERWYLKQIRKEYDLEASSAYNSDTIYGFTRSYNYSTGVSASVKVYGMFEVVNPKSRIKAIRHVLTPSLSFSYNPDFSEEKYNMYGSYIDSDGVEQRYAYHENAVYSTASKGTSGTVSFSLGNTLEMKMLNKDFGDTTSVGNSDDQFKKVSLFDNLSLSTSYNLAADSINLSNISISGRTKVSTVNLNYSMTLDPYAYDTENDHKYNKFEISENGNLARLTAASLSFSYAFKSGKGDDKGGEGEDGEGEEDEIDNYGMQTEEEAMEESRKLMPGSYGKYVEFDVPWSLNMDYRLTYSRPQPDVSPIVSQTIGLRGDLSLTEKWKINFSTNYDVSETEFTYTQFGVSRDLHCWQMSFSMVPFGYRQSYSFTINARSSLLKDLKLQKNQSWYDN